MTLSSRHLRPADHRVMPWKNGQGITTEIAVEPAGAGLESFTWRISIAEIAASGPFSSFPGVERILLQTAGEAMTLVHEGRGRHRLALFQPHCFAGEWITSGEVTGPPVRDFNIMARRDRVRASVAVHELVRGSRVRGLAAASTQVVHAFRGALSVRVSETGEVSELGAGDTWLLSGDRGDDLGFVIEAAAGDAVAFSVAFA
jgi:environmental stress-induced protein Ves